MSRDPSHAHLPDVLPKWLNGKTVAQATLTANALLLDLQDGTTVALYATIEDDGKTGWELFIEHA